VVDLKGEVSLEMLRTHALENHRVPVVAVCQDSQVFGGSGRASDFGGRASGCRPFGFQVEAIGVCGAGFGVWGLGFGLGGLRVQPLTCE
jgi:hypothetical protein